MQRGNAAMDGLLSFVRKLRQLVAAITALLGAIAALVGLIVLIDELMIDQPLRAARRINEFGCALGLRRECGRPREYRRPFYGPGASRPSTNRPIIPGGTGT
jgi:hypothetical protein